MASTATTLQQGSAEVLLSLQGKLVCSECMSGCPHEHVRSMADAVQCVGGDVTKPGAMVRVLGEMLGTRRE